MVAISCKSSSHFRSLSVVNLKIVLAWRLFEPLQLLTSLYRYLKPLQPCFNGLLWVFLKCWLPSNMVNIPLPKINMSPRKGTISKVVFHLPTIDFSRDTLVFVGLSSTNKYLEPKWPIFWMILTHQMVKWKVDPLKRGRTLGWKVYVFFSPSPSTRFHKSISTLTRRIFLVDEEWGDLSGRVTIGHGNLLDTTEFLKKTSPSFFNSFSSTVFSRQQKIKLYMKLHEGRERTQGSIYLYIYIP